MILATWGTVIPSRREISVSVSGSSVVWAATWRRQRRPYSSWAVTFMAHPSPQGSFLGPACKLPKHNTRVSSISGREGELGSGPAVCGQVGNLVRGSLHFVDRRASRRRNRETPAPTSCKAVRLRWRDGCLPRHHHLADLREASASIRQKYTAFGTARP